jgi:DNA-binding NtrC family response regulator
MDDAGRARRAEPRIISRPSCTPGTRSSLPIARRTGILKALARLRESTRPVAAANAARAGPSTMPRLKTLLIVDDDQGMRDTLTAILRKDYRTLAVENAEAALTMLPKDSVDLMLLDVRLPGMSGLDLLKIVKEQYALLEVIVISAVTDVETAVTAIKHGAYHYVTKDFDYDTLRSLVRNASERQDLNRRVITLSAQVAEQSEREFITGPSQAMRLVMDTVHRVAQLTATVLILGESGTGKEMLARLLHRQSERSDAPFIPVNLAAIPSELVESTLFGHEKGSFTGATRQQLGKFELASGGTLFLDEIGDLRIDLQAKLLRAVQGGEIERIGGSKPVKTDFRLICATNVDLERAVKEGRFREDLYYRINVIPIRMPALRERTEDLPEIVRFFINRYSTKFRKPVTGISDSALATLERHWWPGNIRELENLIERLVAMNDRGWIDDEDLPFDYHVARLDHERPVDAPLLEAAVDTFERNFILRALERCDWNVTATARHLGVPLSTLKHKISKLEIRDIAKKLRALPQG